MEFMYLQLTFYIPYRWRGGRAVEGARLEIVYTLTRIEGSNPSLSARLRSLSFARHARIMRSLPGVVKDCSEAKFNNVDGLSAVGETQHRRCNPSNSSIHRSSISLTIPLLFRLLKHSESSFSNKTLLASDRVDVMRDSTLRIIS